MGDRDEVGLPKATMARAIKDRMPAEMRIGNDATELIVKCCEEFVRMISTTANELSEKDKKSTILPEHVLEALEKLGFHPYMEALHAALDEWKEEKKEERKVEREKKKARSGGDLTPEQLLALQQELFQQSRQRTMAMLPPVQDDTSKAADQHAGAES